MKGLRLCASLILLLASGCLLGCGNSLPDFFDEKGQEARAAIASGVEDGLEALKEHGSIGRHYFENEQQAEEFLLDELAKRYGKEFVFVEKKSYTQYGPLYGDVYIAKVAPADQPEQTVWGRALQDGRVTDNYGRYFFEEEAKADLCQVLEAKDYIAAYKAELRGGYTEQAWTKEDDLREYLLKSKGYVRADITLVSGKSEDEYAEMILELLESLYGLDVNTTVEVKNQEHLLFFKELTAAGKQKSALPTLEEIKEQMEQNILIVPLLDN